MTVAKVKFVRGAEKVHVALVVDGTIVAESTRVSLVAREIAARRITHLQLTDTYSISIPTNSDSMAEAAEQLLAEPLATFILISECAW